MSSQYTNLPPAGGGGSGSNASVGTNLTPIPGSSTLVAGENPSGNLTPLNTDANGNLYVNTDVPDDVYPAIQNITVVDSGTTSTPEANGQSWITGTPTAGSSATFNVNGVSNGAIQASGTWTGTLQVEVSVDGGTTYTPHSIHQFGSSLYVTTFTQNIIGSLNLVGKTNVRIRATAAVTGTAVIKVVESSDVATIYVANGIKVVDGTATTNVPTLAIKAASTAPLATDPAVVVAISPNSNQATAANQAAVIGTVAPGTAATNSELIGGVYSSTPPTLTNAQQAALQLNSSGSLKVDGSAVTQPVSLAGVSTAANQTAVIGTVAAGTAATNSELVGMVYNSTPPAPTNGQQLAIQSDAFGNQLSVLTDLLLTGQSAQTATVNNILPATAGATATNAANYKSASVQVTSTGTGGTFIFEGSNDNVNFQAIVVYNQSSLTGTPISAAITASASQIVYVFPIVTQYIRLRIASTITGGSIQAFTRLSQAAFTAGVTQVAQTTAANLATTATIASGTVTTVSTVTAVSSVTSSQTAKPGLVNDVASAAITTTTTTAAFTPTFGSSYLVDIPVTAVSGTTPTLSVAVQESPDSGTNWYTVYTFPTITATGSYTSPVITMTGTQVRYVQTITGTTPSFTRAINRVQSSQSGYNLPTQGILSDSSGTTSGTINTSTQLMAANPQRKYLLLQNPGTVTVWFNFTTAATTSQPSFQLPAGGSFVQESGFVSTEAINVICGTASQPITAKQA